MALSVGSATNELTKLGIDGDFAASVPNLQKTLHLLTTEQVKLAKMLLENGQSHLFQHWAEPGVDDDQKKAFFDQAGVEIADPVIQVFNGQEVEMWPRITWKPKWGLTFSEVKRKIRELARLSQNSNLAIKGRNIFLEDLCLDGALIVDAVDEAKVKVRGAVQNKGWTVENVDYKDASLLEEIRIRGLNLTKLSN